MQRSNKKSALTAGLFNASLEGFATVRNAGYGQFYFNSMSKGNF